MTSAPPLTLAELDQLLRAADPAARLVPPRVLRRIIKHHCHVTGLGLQVPHRKTYVLDRLELLQCIDPFDLGLPTDDKLPVTVILLERPEPQRLAAMPRGPALIKYWRLLFHARVHLAFDERWKQGQITDARLRQRIDAIGPTEFDEIRAVLRAEKFLLPPADNFTAYSEFAAVYLELRYFAPWQLSHYFPTLDDPTVVDRLLAEDVAAEDLFRLTRLSGAPDPDQGCTFKASDTDPDQLEQGTMPGVGASLAVAEIALQRGNVVRAAIAWTQAGDEAQATVALEQLIGRLEPALETTTEEAQPLYRILPRLLNRAAASYWPLEARFLYDLQKVCLDHEQAVFVPRPFKALFTAGRTPLAQPLPLRPPVNELRHLRSAVNRVAQLRLPAEERERLGGFLRHVLERKEHELRSTLQPILEDAFRKVGLEPGTFVEQVAFQKLCQELLDQLVASGFLSMSHLRDALARNQLKLPDLSTRSFIHGDRLLRADRLLEDSLLGVYRRGEFYLRWLQRFSALAFGTRLGRFLTRYVAIPYGSAYVGLEGLQHLLHLFLGVQENAGDFDDTESLGERAQQEAVRVGEGVLHVSTPTTVLLVGTLLLILLHWPAARQALGQAVRLVFRGLRALFIRLPARFLHLPLVQKLLESRVAQVLHRFVVKPLLPALGVFLLLRLCRVRTSMAALPAGGTFLICSLLVATRLGRELEERTADWFARQWDLIRRDVLPGIFRLVMDTFKQILEATDRLLYNVDEWLRFRSGDSRSATVFKTLFQPLWSVVSYVFRTVLILFIEPQINPIKHFPVVTVCHKLLLPLIPHLGGLLALTMEKGLAYTTATVVIFSIPGFFGFLVWELKENWRLYEANRSPTLDPVPIGHHGETMVRLLRPGFHSGTLPRLYGQLRRQARKAQRTGNPQPLRAIEANIHHVLESVATFLERNFLVLLQRSRTWTAGPIHLGHLRTGSNRILVPLHSDRWPEEEFLLSFEEQSRWLVVGVERPGWLPRLGTSDTLVLRNALLGLYKLGGVELIREQLEQSFVPGRPSYDIADVGLLVWPDERYDTEVIYDLKGGPLLTPGVMVGKLPPDLPTLEAGRVRFRDTPILWRDWTVFWEAEQSAALEKEVPLSLILPEITVLPPTPA